MFYGSFGTQKLMVAFFFMFGLRKGQCQLKLGQIRSTFQIQAFRTKPYFCLVLFRMPKMLFIFRCGIIIGIKKTGKGDDVTFLKCNFKCQIIAFQKSYVITFTRLFYHCITKNKDNAFTFCKCIVC